VTHALKAFQPHTPYDRITHRIPQCGIHARRSAQGIGMPHLLCSPTSAVSGCAENPGSLCHWCDVERAHMADKPEVGASDWVALAKRMSKEYRGPENFGRLDVHGAMNPGVRVSVFPVLREESTYFRVFARVEKSGEVSRRNSQIVIREEIFVQLGKVLGRKRIGEVDSIFKI